VPANTLLDDLNLRDYLMLLIIELNLADQLCLMKMEDWVLAINVHNSCYHRHNIPIALDQYYRKHNLNS